MAIKTTSSTIHPVRHSSSSKLWDNRTLLDHVSEKSRETKLWITMSTMVMFSQMLKDLNEQYDPEHTARRGRGMHT